MATVRMRKTFVTPSAAPVRILCQALSLARLAQAFWESRLEKTWLRLVYIFFEPPFLSAAVHATTAGSGQGCPARG